MPMKSMKIAIAILALATAAAADVRGSFQKTLTVSGAADVTVQTGSGTISVHTGSGSSVQVSARIQASDHWFNGSGLSAEERVKRIEANPPVTQNGNTIVIGKIEDPDLRKNVGIDYDVTVPAQTKLRTESGSGDLKITGVAGPLNARSGSGTVSATDIGSSVRVSTGSGDVHLRNVKGGVNAETGSGGIDANNVDGTFYGETGSGDITMSQTSPGTVTAKTGSGTIRLSNVVGGATASSGSGDISISGEAKSGWSAHSGSGTIHMSLPKTSNFDVDAHSSSGSVKVSRPITIESAYKQSKLKGKVGNGGVLLEASTGSGDIRIE
jgi:hypothetical protein